MHISIKHLTAALICIIATMLDGTVYGDPVNVNTLGGRFQLTAAKSTEKRKLPVLDGFIVNIWVNKLNMSQVVWEMAKLEAIYPGIKSCTMIPSEAAQRRVGDWATKHMGTTGNIYNGKEFDNDPEVTFEGNHLTVGEFFNGICRKSGWSYFHGVDGWITFSEDTRYFIVSEALAKDGFCIVPDPHLHGSNPLALKFRKVVIPGKPMQEVLNAIGTAINICNLAPMRYQWNLSKELGGQSPVVSLNASNISLREMLDSLCKQCGWTYVRNPYMIWFSQTSPEKESAK